MKIITHDWNGYGIAQLKERTVIAKFDVPKGYVNATQMCKANGKQWGAYKSLKITQEYLAALSVDLKTSIKVLVVEIDCYGKDQATWIHLEIAVDLSRWIGFKFYRWLKSGFLVAVG
jgi:hypothetical protein